MTLRNRIVLIVLGTLIFLTAGPILVLAARGYYFDFAARRLVRTGTITAKTDPRGAAVFLDGKNLGDTPFVKRFVLPGEYLLEIAKPDYLSWKKIFTVEAGQVFSLPASSEKIYLLREKPEEIFRAATNTPGLGGAEDSGSQFYIATSTGQLFFRPNSGGQDETIAAGLPHFKTKKIIVSPDRQVFLLLDDSLYQVGETLIKLNDRVAYANWSAEGTALVYGSAHEIWLYRPEAGGRGQLITRVAEPIGEAIFHEGIGYFFWSGGQKIMALEYDPALTPSLYTLAQTKSPQVPLSINSPGTSLTYYDSGELVTLKIR